MMKIAFLVAVVASSGDYEVKRGPSAPVITRTKFHTEKSPKTGSHTSVWLNGKQVGGELAEQVIGKMNSMMSMFGGMGSMFPSFPSLGGMFPSFGADSSRPSMHVVPLRTHSIRTNGQPGHLLRKHSLSGDHFHHQKPLFRSGFFSAPHEEEPSQKVMPWYFWVSLTLSLVFTIAAFAALVYRRYRAEKKPEPVRDDIRYNRMDIIA